MNRRSLLLGLGALIAAPAVIRTAGLLMPVRAMDASAYQRMPAQWHLVGQGRLLYAAPTPVGLMNGDGPENAGSFRALMDAARPGDHVILASGGYMLHPLIGRAAA